MRIGDLSFFRVIDRLIGDRPNARSTSARVVHGVNWQRQRHSYANTQYSFAIEVTTFTKIDPPRWTLLVTKEYWWKGDAREVVRTLQWANLTSGRRKDVIDWLKLVEDTLKR